MIIQTPKAGLIFQRLFQSQISKQVPFKSGVYQYHSLLIPRFFTISSKFVTALTLITMSMTTRTVSAAAGGAQLKTGTIRTHFKLRFTTHHFAFLNGLRALSSTRYF